MVALESTLITHGLAAPMNLEAARRAEAAVRAGGAEPATIAVLEGRIHVGLSEAELEALAAQYGARKASRATLALALNEGVWAGTTVSATMICAHLAGIRVFATGGIGGVHRGGERRSTYPRTSTNWPAPQCLSCAQGRSPFSTST